MRWKLSTHTDLIREKSKILYCKYKQPLPNIFLSTAYKKHISFLLDQKNENFSKMFIFLLSTLDRKEELNQYSNNVNFHSVEVSYDQLKKLNSEQDFDLADSDNISKRNKVKKLFYSFMKEAAGISNHNLVRNSNAFISNGGEMDAEYELSWINYSYIKLQQKFQLGY